MKLKKLQNKNLFIIGISILFSCKEKKQETIHSDPTIPSETSVVYSKYKHDTLKQSNDPINIKSINNKPIQTYPSDLKGTWAVICQNELTTLDINKNEGYLSLYDFNAIYINLKVEKLSKNEYLLKYASLSSQENYYEDHLKIVDEEISKDKVIGKLILKNNGKAELQWIGLYNMKKQKLEFVGNDFLLIKENGGKTPLILEPCH